MAANLSVLAAYGNVNRRAVIGLPTLLGTHGAYVKSLNIIVAGPSGLISAGVTQGYISDGSMGTAPTSLADSLTNVHVDKEDLSDNVG
jgi:hypothetical protein